MFERLAICSPLALASRIGREVLLDGGNAVDAAIATNVVLAVAYPHMCGVGGDLLAMVWADGELAGLNSSGALPRNAPPLEGPVPFRGIGSATVPGAVAGWSALAERFGTRPLHELARPAIELARDGVVKPPSLLRMLEQHRQVPFLDAEASGIFAGQGRLIQPQLATTLDELDSFYDGRVAERAPDPFTPDDFRAHRAEWVEPMRRGFAGIEVCEMPPNSRGHLVLEALGRLESLDGLTPADAAWHARLLRAITAVDVASDTIYLCCVDASGMAVSLNQSLFAGFGSGVMVPGTGVLLHNRGAFHTVESYVGGAKPVHTLSPAMCLQEGRPQLVFGTMGGTAQIQIHLQLLARILIAGENVQAAIDAPRWVYKSGRMGVEPGLPDLSDALPGTEIVPIDSPEDAGHAHAIEIEATRLAAAVDPRSDGVPLGE